ncbi:ParB/RepB/Spo0J family partition protein, partial [Mediterraneibacter glycyrrhizinilyticus]
MEEKEKIIEIEIERLRDFKEHPFQVKDDEEMRQLKDSISEYGVLNPLIVRPRPEGVYEIISGHRRKYASQKLGYTKLPVIIRVMTDEEAIIAMIDSNLQREKISHSEKAYAYMMKNEALKRKVGRKRSQSGHRLKGKKTVELISEASGDSPKQVQHLLLLICRNISMICRRIRKMTDQYAIYRVNLLTEGKNLWQKSFEQVRKEHLPVRIDLYRQIHISFSEKDESVMEIWKKTRNITEVSDVLVLNHSGEISCYYVNEDAPRRITGFIRLNPSGTLVSLDT